MTRPQIELDFARKRPRVNRIGAALFAAGILGATLVIANYRSMTAENAGLEMRLVAISPGPDAAIPDPAAMRVAEEARAAVSELATPWSILLKELELASEDRQNPVAILAVEPDREKHQVRVVAEARTLLVALAYVKRLQSSQAMRFPMLESHEVQAKDPERPVRFQIKADWRVAP
jgi:ABC-type lipoprotein release transport system permease subunit